jgi:hypothetical protein
MNISSGQPAPEWRGTTKSRSPACARNREADQLVEARRRALSSPRGSLKSLIVPFSSSTLNGTLTSRHERPSKLFGAAPAQAIGLIANATTEIS